jgi:DNA-binding NarL/FixJ family response regulator
MSGELAQSTVLIVDDHHLVRGGLRMALDRAEDLEVVGEASCVAEALEALDRLSPRVLVTDVGLPDGDGIALVRSARKARPELGIVVLTMYTSDKELFGALESGASAFVGKDAPAHEVVAAARHAAVSPNTFIAPGLIEAIQRRMAAPAQPQLSPRECEVLELLVDGFAIRQIARRLFISESTAKTHVANIYQKLGVGNRAQAVVTAFRMGLVRRPGWDGDGTGYSAR